MIRPAATPSADLARQLSNLIAALEREWKEDLGGPEAPETAIVLQKTHRLLTTITGGKPLVLAGDARLSDYLGNAWANVHIDNIHGVLAQWLANRSGATV